MIIPECEEYSELAYKNVSFESSILGEPPQVKKVNKCLHDSVGLIVGGEDAKVNAKFSNLTF
jgi:hypothetical protein